MSVYNGERYLREAILSILRQTWTDYEFLIINDGSTDNSREIIASFDDPRIRLLDNTTNIGLTKSLNRGLELARGEFIARQDADDISHPTRIEQQVNFLNSHPDVVLLGTQQRAIDLNGNSTSIAGVLPIANLSIKWCLMFQNAFAHTSVMYRRKVVWDQMQGYDESFIRSQDFELWSRIVEKHAARNLPKVLVDLRRHSESIMTRNQIRNIWLEKIILTNLTRFSGFDRVPTRWASLIHSPYTGQVEKPEQLMNIIEAVFTRFCDLHPEAATDQEIRRLRAAQRVKIAYLLAPHRRLLSLQTWARACRLDLGVTRRVSLLKYVVLLLGGNFIRRKLRGT
jgi:glycosyltransferase involved in cell wall biosynthesis